jgi:hypothetical protein
MAVARAKQIRRTLQDDLVEIAPLMTIDGKGAEPEVLAALRQLLNATSSPVIVKWSEL